MKIYIGYHLSPAERDLTNEIQEPDDHWIFSQDLKESDRKDAFLEAEVVVGNIPPEWIPQSTNLRWLQLTSTGFNSYLDLNWNKIQNVQVCNLRDFYGQPVAESAVAGIMAFYRRIDKFTNLQLQNKWVGLALRPEMDLLHKKKVLLLGAGTIGNNIKKFLEAFDCEVTVVRKSSSPNLDDLDNLLPGADIIVTTLPESEETVGVFDEKRIALMKKDALFVNVGRGSVIDEQKLIEALQNSKIKGAVLDVTETEPLPGDHPLWDLPNVILTQHTGGGYREEKMDMIRFFIENFKRYRSGEELMHLVDFHKGY
ncbi:D-2-hydroxyacid dehydrogenase [soil metagenome]